MFDKLEIRLEGGSGEVENKYSITVLRFPHE
jgi:hypothetical protein